MQKIEKLFLSFLICLLLANIGIAQNTNFDLEGTFNRELTPEQRKAIKDNIYNYSQEINANNSNAHAHLNRGVMYAKLGLFPDAISDYNKSIRIDSTIPEAYYNRGLARARFRFTKFSCIDIKRAAEMGLSVAEKSYENNCGFFKMYLGEIEK